MILLSIIDFFDSPPDSWRYSSERNKYSYADDIVDTLSRVIIFIPFFNIWWVPYFITLFGMGATLTYADKRFKLVKILGSDVMFLVSIYIYSQFLLVAAMIVIFCYQLILYYGYLFPHLYQGSNISELIED